MSIFGLFDAATEVPWRTPPRAHQLALPGLDVALERWDVIVAGMGAVRVTVTFYTQRLELMVTEHQPEGYVVAQLTVSLAPAWCYGLAYDQPLGAEAWAFGAEDVAPGGALYELGRTITSHVAAGTGIPALLGAFLTDVAERSAALADPRALEVARTFAPSDRLAVHALLASDRTGRLAQLATVAPALVTIMAGGLAQPAVSLAVGGARLVEVTRAVIDTSWRWPAHVRELGLRQRQWLLRAPASAPRHVIDRVVPRHFVLDDVPDDLSARARHYEVMAWLDDASANLPDEKLLRGVTRFVSKHALAIYERPDWRGRIVSLLRRVKRTERGPTRRASLDQWLPRSAPKKDPAFLIERFERDASCIVRLNSRAALTREGEQMRHCAGSLADQVERGELAVFSVDDTIDRATLALEWDAKTGTWEATDLHGPANSSPSRSIETLVDAFVRAHHGYIVGFASR